MQLLQKGKKYNNRQTMHGIQKQQTIVANFFSFSLAKIKGTFL